MLRKYLPKALHKCKILVSYSCIFRYSPLFSFDGANINNFLLPRQGKKVYTNPCFFKLKLINIL